MSALAPAPASLAMPNRTLLAIITTTACASMAGMAAFQRAPDTAGAMMLAGLAIATVVGSHLLPALARGHVARLIAVVCALVTIYGYAHLLDDHLSLGMATALELAGVLLWAIVLPRHTEIADVQEVRVKHVVPYGTTPALPAAPLLRCFTAAYTQAQPRDSPTTA